MSSTRMSTRLSSWLAGGLALMFACAAPTKGPEAKRLDPHDVPVFTGRTGERVDLEDVAGAIEAADIVVLGELHGHPSGLAWNEALFAESVKRRPNAALCLEFLTRDTQYLVDAYAAGIIDFDGLERACKGVPGSNPVPHRPMIETACAAGAPVVAANAPRIYTRAAREHGYARLEALSPEQQRLYDTPVRQLEGSYREGFFDKMREHGAEPAEASSPVDDHMEGVFRAQCLWDSTMAASVATTFESGHQPSFLVVGSFHCNDDGGTVQLIREACPDARILVVTFVAETSEELLEEHVASADFVAYVGPRP